MTAVAGDLFPPAPRVFYRKAPLVQVTCQVRFPALLKLEEGLPATFQERIRHGLPLMERPATPIPLPPQLPPEVAEAIRAQAGLAAWRFLTEDRKTTLGLAPDSLTLSTTAYHSWPTFLAQWRPAFSALVDIYAPSYFSRAGLRYQDLIVRENLGLELTPWSELIRKELLGEAAIPEIEQCVQDAFRLLRLRLPNDQGMMVIQHGTGQQIGGNGLGYLIDLDFATSTKTEVNDAESALSDLHANVWRAFRWCITQRLHNALGPSESPDNG